MNAWSSRTPLAMVFCLSSIVATPTKAEEPAGPTNGHKVLTHPGPDTAAVAAFLTRIRDGRAKAESQVGDLMIRGRTSSVSLPWKEGLTAQTAATLPPPDWCQFILVHKGEKRRYDQEYVRTSPGAECLTTVYRLNDGKAFYKLDGNSLEIFGPEGGGKLWENLANGYFGYGHIHDDRSIAPVADACRALIDRVGKPEEWKGAVLRCNEEDGLLAVTIDYPGRKLKSEKTFWVDPRRGYHVVRTRHEWGSEGQTVNYLDEARVEIAEPAPGVFVPARATRFICDAGSIARRDSRAGWGRSDMEVVKVRVGQFAYEDRLFGPASLPVPKDVIVSDDRGSRRDTDEVLERWPLIDAGKDAPRFEVPLAGGGKFRSKDSARGGRHVLVTFWFCDCPPCREELAHLNGILDGLRAANVDVLAINVGDADERVQEFVKDRELKMTIGLGGEIDRSAVAKAYGAQAFPTSYLIGPDGKVVWRKVGFDEAELTDALKKAVYLSEKGHSAPK
jgi:peroxiredoxin